MQIIKKYMRIQGHEYSYGTGKPTGVFSLCIRRVDNGIFSKEDAKIFNDTNQWFKDNLVQPPFYEQGNPDRAITYFKTDNYEAMREKSEILTGLLDKYNVPYDIVFTDHAGKIIYEDEYQVGVIADD